MAAGRQHREAGRHGPAHMKQREAVDHDVILVQAMNLRETPRRVNLIAVRQADELGPSRRPAGMEERADGFPGRSRLELQCFVAVPAGCFLKLDHRSAGGARISEHYDFLQCGRAPDDVLRLLPNGGVGIRRGKHENGCILRGQQIGDDFGAEEIVDRAGDARGLRAQQRFHHPFDDGAEERDRAAFRSQQAVKQVRRTDGSAYRDRDARSLTSVPKILPPEWW